MRLLLVGDVHGRFERLAAALAEAQTRYRIGAAIQVGDFGFGPAWGACAASGLRFPVPVHAIDGNHDDHAWLAGALAKGEGARWAEACGLVCQTRGSVARFGATKAGFLGGALHVDRPQQHNLRAGAPNYILRRQREAAAALFARESPDLLVTHSCPCRIGIGMRASGEHAPGVHAHITSAGFDPGPEDDCGEAELTALWQALSPRPRAWVFGHFHRSRCVEVGGTEFSALDDDLDSPARLFTLWDTEEKRLLRCPADPSHR